MMTVSVIFMLFVMSSPDA